MNNHTAMILAAGLGTRLKELTHDTPKALVKIGSKTLLERNIENLIRNGFDTIIVNIHHFGEQVIRFIETHTFNADIYISDERGQLMDTGGGIIQALPFFHDTQAVMVHNVDILSDTPLQSLYEQFLHSHDQAWLLCQDRNTTRKLLFDEQNLLVGWKNLKDNSYKWVDNQQDTYKELAFNGIHIFRPNIFSDFDPCRYSIIDLYLTLARNNHVRAIEIQPTYWYDIGKIENFSQIATQLHLLSSKF